MRLAILFSPPESSPVTNPNQHQLIKPSIRIDRGLPDDTSHLLRPQHGSQARRRRAYQRHYQNRAVGAIIPYIWLWLNLPRSLFQTSGTGIVVMLVGARLSLRSLLGLHRLHSHKGGKKKKKRTSKRTTPGIRQSSPTWLLIRRYLACLWEIERDPEFSRSYGRT
ncbi:hypothetical protein M426DRAFT_209575 [Hypoxylon sp. CI-4A]|nr:hypothetical protein M426DRAFT_209575 [Hypoxylon sp. CI-4A]